MRCLFQHSIETSRTLAWEKRSASLAALEGLRCHRLPCRYQSYRLNPVKLVPVWQAQSLHRPVDSGVLQHDQWTVGFGGHLISGAPEKPASPSGKARLVPFWCQCHLMPHDVAHILCGESPLETLRDAPRGSIAQIRLVCRENRAAFRKLRRIRKDLGSSPQRIPKALSRSELILESRQERRPQDSSRAVRGLF